jgi:23S rRNA A2030 N6-methylase RlmJ
LNGNKKTEPYDHQTKAGNNGDVVKHPALVATLNGLLAEHQGVFRYADTFAGRWENDLGKSDAWRKGIGQFAERWDGGNPDIEFWRAQWTSDPSGFYPGSTKLAKEILSQRGSCEIRAFEIEKDYAEGLRRELGNEAVFKQSASASDWERWTPDLLFIDPPGLKSEEDADSPSPESLLQSAEGANIVLMWLPMIAGTNKGCDLGSINNTVDELRAAFGEGFQLLAVCWDNGGPMPGCFIAHRFRSSKVAQRVDNAVLDVVKTMGTPWRVV